MYIGPAAAVSADIWTLPFRAGQLVALQRDRVPGQLAVGSQAVQHTAAKRMQAYGIAAVH